MTHAIDARGLSKRYRLGATADSLHLRQALSQLWGRKGQDVEDVRTLWALRDVSFQAPPGEVLGVIGRNGAGKSTLLKLLARITSPTEGNVRLRGRVGSLLEVGTGFHPELTGRENVDLNAAILGMRRHEVARKLDAIVDFAGVERFLDTPVKRYSSGMKLRLAFAVAAFLEPEILFVDEVLSVGDLSFQKKSVAKIKDTAQSGASTILFVSHNLATIRAICSRVLLLEQGRLVADGPPEKVLATYVSRNLESYQSGTLDDFRRLPIESAACYVSAMRMPSERLSDSGLPRFSNGEQACLELDLVARETVRNLVMIVRFDRGEGEQATLIYSGDRDQSIDLEPPGARVRIHLGQLPFAPGDYHAEISLCEHRSAGIHDQLVSVPAFTIGDAPDTQGIWPTRPWGVVHLDQVRWEVEPGFPGPG